MKDSSAVLLSWVARNNDPFEKAAERVPSRGEAPPLFGPTLTLLFDPASPFVGKVGDVVLLYRIASDPKASAGDRQAVDKTKREIEKRLPRIRVHAEMWRGDDPTEHRALFDYLQKLVPSIRQRFKGRELLIHISPGTPAMHTLWVLMAECGFIEPPFKVVKSYRQQERGGLPAVVEVKLGIESFYKVYRASQPRQRAAVESAVFWDPARFRSPRLKALFAEARRYAGMKVPVLILGERGTGKTTLAGWLRSNSPFRREELDKRWPSVACGQFGGGTIKSELFGHKAHSFTDAKTDKQGLLSVAHGDTLFLDEIGDISRDVQRMLIRVLEEKTYTPLGGEAEHPLDSDFRLITATNLPPHVLQERLDADFLDRISPFELRVPALREIPEDIDWIWEAMYQAAVDRAELEAPPPPLRATEQSLILERLRTHPLPGNLRDLLRLAYRLVAFLKDPERPESLSECVEAALAGLSTAGDSHELDPVRAAAAAFSRHEPLDAVLRPGEKLQLDRIAGEFQTYVAHEIARIAQARGVSEASLYTGVSDRTLRNWKNPEVSKSASGSRKKTSEGS